MKRIEYLILSAFLIAAVSCEDLRFGNAMLEKPTGNTTTIDTVFSCRTYAERALTAAYMSLPTFMMKGKLENIDFLESFTDINNGSMGYGPMKKLHYPGIVTAATPAGSMRYNFLNGGWPGIRKAYIFIENVGRVPEDGPDPMSPEEKQLRTAEAYAIIALHYVDMFRHFGGLPEVDHACTSEEAYMENVQVPRMTIKETVDFIVRMLDEKVIPYLPWYVDEMDDGRMTSAAAVALKIRLLHFAASPLFNSDEPFMEGEASDKHLVWWGNYDLQRWQAVLDAVQQFEKMNAENGYFYKLVNTGKPRDDFRAAFFSRYNNEVIISTRNRNNFKNLSWFNYCNNGIGNATLNYVNMFPMKDGNDFSWNNPEHAANPFFNGRKEVRDPRLYETVAVNGDAGGTKWLGREVQSYLGGGDRRAVDHEKTLFASGFCIRKFRNDASKGWRNNRFQNPYMRYAEIILIKAEALNELGRTDEAYTETAKIRQRVEMPNIKSGMDQAQFREAILRERALEFGYEEVRFFDLVRCKRKDIFMTKLQGLDITSVGKDKFTYQIFDLPTFRSWQSEEGWRDRFYLTPIPKSEVLKGYGLIQNPGW